MHVKFVTQQAFLEIRDVCEKNGIELQVVMLPELHDLVDYPFGEVYSKVAAFLRANEIEVLDLTPFFLGIEDAGSLWVASDDAHPNELAHAMIAEYAHSYVKMRIVGNGQRD